MTDSDSRGSSVVRRWQLAAALKGFREEAGVTQEQAVEALRRTGGRWSESKLSRIENHESGVRPREVELLLDVYEVTDPAVREPLLSLAEAARQRDWRANYGPDLPESLRPLVSVENAVTAIRQFETMVVPGLLQTADYTRALIETIDPAATTPIEVERRVARRITRQHILRRPDPPTFHLIVDEGLLRRTVGSRSVMRDQLRKLVDLAEAPHMTVQVLPFDHGGAGVEGPFTLLSLPDPASDIVYGEGFATGSVFVEDRETVRTCTLRFGMLTHLALPRVESLEALKEAASSFE